MNDFLVFGATALTSLAAGKLLAWFSWDAVNYAVFPLVAVGLVMIGWLAIRGRPPSGASGRRPSRRRPLR